MDSVSLSSAPRLAQEKAARLWAVHRISKLISKTSGLQMGFGLTTQITHCQLEPLFRRTAAASQLRLVVETSEELQTKRFPNTLCT